MSLPSPRVERYGLPPGVAAELRAARESRHLSQGALALSVGITRPMVTRMEGGTRRPSRAVAERLIETLSLGDRAALILRAVAST